MRANVNSSHKAYVTVFMNGKKINDCISADEEKGEAWVAYRNAQGKLVPEYDAEKGALFHDGIQVIKLTGKVEIRVEPFDVEPFNTKDKQFVDAREVVEFTSYPLKIYYYTE